MKLAINNYTENNPYPGPITPVRIPNNLVGLIIGKNGDTIKMIHQKTGCFIFIPKECKPGDDHRVIEVSGLEDKVKICVTEIQNVIDNVIKLF